MTASTFFVSETSFSYLKQKALKRVTGVGSAHMSEAVAAALGFKTYAAFRAKLGNEPTVEVDKPDNGSLVQRLRQLGYGNVPDDLRLLPELNKSYSPFRIYDLKPHRGERWKAWRNLMVAGINAGLEQRHFGLSAGQDWWPGADPKGNQSASFAYSFVFDNDLPAKASVDAISGDELTIHVVLQPRRETVDPACSYGFRDGVAIAHCWLERRIGAWIHDGEGQPFACKRAMQSRIAAAAVVPRGYSDFGAFFG